MIRHARFSATRKCCDKRGDAACSVATAFILVTSVTAVTLNVKMRKSNHCLSSCSKLGHAANDAFEPKQY